MTFELRHEDEAEKAIKSFTSRVMRRLYAAGDHTHQREDVEQELRVAWLTACAKYTADSGVPFMAYFRRGMMQHINRYIEKHVERRHGEVNSLSLNYTPEFDPEGRVMEGSAAETVPTEDPTPDVAITELSQFQWAMSKLQPRAQLFLKLLSDQPAELLAEVQKVEQRCEHGKGLGMSSPFLNRLTATMIFDLMGATRSERLAITNEIREIGKLACNTD